MTETKAKAPFISGPYYKEIFREMKTIGIIFCILQTVVGLLENFGSPLLVTFIMFTGTSKYRNFMLVYFFVAALNFLNAYIKRSAWDLRGSLPLKKRTVFASHLAAALTWAAFIFVANYVGTFMGELMRLGNGIRASGVPAGFFGSALALLHEAALGLLVYGCMTMLGSVVNKAFTIIIAGVSIIAVPALYYGFAQNMSVSNFTIAEHLLPIGSAARHAVLTALLVLAALIAIVLAYIAFSNARAETQNKPARTKAIHIAIGLAFAAFIGLSVMSTTASEQDISLAGIRSGANYDADALTTGLIVCAILMLIAYMAYMWISLKSFKKACKNLIFLPIAIVFIASALILTAFADGQFERLDTDVNNVDHITIPNGAYENSILDYSTSMLFGGGSIARGSNGSERVELTDIRLLRAGARALSTRKDGTNVNLDPLESMLEGLFIGGYTRDVEVTLKNGSTWTVPVSSYQFNLEFTPYVLESEEFTSRYTDMKRFRGGHVLNVGGLDAEFTKTLTAEIESLSPKDRMEIFADLTTAYDSELGFNIDFGTVKTELAKVTLVSPSYDHVAAIRLTNLLPKSREMYMQKVSEYARKSRHFDEIVERLETCDYDSVFGTLELVGNGRVNIMNFDLYPNDKDFEASYRVYSKRISELLARLIKENSPVEGAEYVVGISIDSFTTLQDSGVRFENLSFRGGTVYVGVSKEIFDDLVENFVANGGYDGGYDEVDPDAEWM